MLLLTLAPLFEEIHLMHWAKRSFMLSGSPAKGRQYGFKCRQACKQLGCKWRREWRSSSRVIQTFINPKEITVRLLLRFYWWPYISCSDWWTRGKKLPWQQLSSSACNSCKLVRRHAIFQSGNGAVSAFWKRTKWFKGLEYKSSSLYYLNVWTMKWLTVWRLQRPQSEGVWSSLLKAYSSRA